MRSWSIVSCPTTFGDSRSMTAVMPGEPKPSSNSLQPVTPSSVVSFRK